MGSEDGPLREGGKEEREGRRKEDGVRAKGAFSDLSSIGLSGEQGSRES